jgi:ABC-type multidrug transport system fused ATPase/permease subunit
MILKPILKFKLLAILVVCFQVIGILSQVFSMLILIKIVHLFQSDWVLHLMGVTFDFSKQPKVAFSLAVAIIFILFITNAICSFYEKKFSSSLCIKSEKFALRHLAKTLTSIYVIPQKKYSRLISTVEIRKYASRAGRYLGRTVISAVGAFVPLVTMIVSYAILLKLRLGLTLTLSLILIIAAPIYLFIGLRGKRSTAAMIEFAPKMIKDRVTCLDNFLSMPSKPTNLTQQDLEGLYNSNPANEFFNAYQFRLMMGGLNVAFTKFVQTAMIIVIVLSGIMPLVFQEGKPSLGNFLSYLVAFRFFGGGLLSVAGIVSPISAFYSFCQPMVIFFEENSKKFLNKESTADTEGNPPQLFSGITIHRIEKKLLPQKSLVVTSPTSINWTNMGWFLSNIVKLPNKKLKTLMKNTALLSSNYSTFSETPPFYFTNKIKGINEHDLSSVFPNIFPDPKKIDDLTTSLKSETTVSNTWNSLSKGERITFLAYLTKVTDSPSLFLIDGNALTDLTKEQQKELIDYLSDGLIIVFYDKPFKLNKIHSENFKFFIKLDTNGIKSAIHFSELTQEIINDIKAKKSEKGTKVEDMFLEDF